jgi:anti-sigma factor RsiW
MEEREEMIYTLMMEALDGELSETGWNELEAHLRVRPDLAREWIALRAIDRLFRHAPALSPAADFTQRTLARLPNRRVRLRLVTIFYILLLVSGFLPLLIIGLLTIQFAPAIFEPALISGLLQVGNQVISLAGVVLTALFAGLADLLRQQQLAVAGWLLVMLGLVALWSGVYRQLVLLPRSTS